MWRYDATVGADETESVIGAFEFHALFERLFFDVLANAIFAGAARLHAMTALIESEVVEGAVKVNFSLVEMLACHLEKGLVELRRGFKGSCYLSGFFFSQR